VEGGSSVYSIEEEEIWGPDGMTILKWDVIDFGIIISESGVDPRLASISLEGEPSLVLINFDDIDLVELDCDQSGISTIDPIRTDVGKVLWSDDGVHQPLDFDLLVTVDPLIVPLAQVDETQDQDDRLQKDHDGNLRNLNLRLLRRY